MYGWYVSLCQVSCWPLERTPLSLSLTFSLKVTNPERNNKRKLLCRNERIYLVQMHIHLATVPFYISILKISHATSKKSCSALSTNDRHAFSLLTMLIYQNSKGGRSANKFRNSQICKYARLIILLQICRITYWEFADPLLSVICGFAVFRTNFFLRT